MAAAVKEARRVGYDAGGSLGKGRIKQTHAGDEEDGVAAHAHKVLGANSFKSKHVKNSEKAAAITEIGFSFSYISQFYCLLYLRF